jgi:RimJ/RimL family protein N-acetyltransferase
MGIRAELQTARLTLRPVAPEDGAAVVTWLNDLAVSGWLAVVPYPYGATDFQQFLTGYAEPGRTWTILEGDTFAGIIGLEDDTLGYWLAPPAQGRGIATEAARAVLAERLAQTAAPASAPVTAGCFLGNARSQNVLRKLGFVETGRRLKHCRALGHDRDHADLSLTHEAFRAALPWEARSARLTYRPLQAIDRDALHAIICQHAVTRQLGPHWPWPADPAFTLTRARPFVGQGFVWGLFLHGSLIGTVGVTAGELGYAIDPAHHRQGLATEACRTALAHAFGPMGLASAMDSVMASVWSDNQASLGLLAKLGFTVTGHDLGTNACRPEPSPGTRFVLSRPAFHGAANIQPGVRPRVRRV